MIKISLSSNFGELYLLINTKMCVSLSVYIVHCIRVQFNDIEVFVCKLEIRVNFSNS